MIDRIICLFFGHCPMVNRWIIQRTNECDAVVPDPNEPKVCLYCRKVLK